MTLDQLSGTLKVSANILDELLALEKAATPGPWEYDCGNQEIESRDKIYFRAVICDQPSTFQWTGDKDDKPTDPRYECCPGVKPLDIRDDMEFIAAMRNHARALIQIASYAKSLFSEDGAFEAVSHFNVAVGLKEALSRLDEVQK